MFLWADDHCSLYYSKLAFEKGSSMIYIVTLITALPTYGLSLLLLFLFLVYESCLDKKQIEFMLCNGNALSPDFSPATDEPSFKQVKHYCDALGDVRPISSREFKCWITVNQLKYFVVVENAGGTLNIKSRLLIDM